MRIPFLDIRSGYLELKPEIDDAVSRVLHSGCYIHGAEVEAFEKSFAEFAEVPYAVGVANGLDALVLCLEALGIGYGDEVIVPSNTFIATWLAVTHCGATPVPVDPDVVTRNIDPAKIEAAITPRTRAIIVVHLYGFPADLDLIAPIATKHHLKVIEDAAQAHGARYKGARIGGYSDLVAWSFYPGKNLGAFGDGGAITCRDIVISEKLKALRNYGSRSKYQHDIKGYNSRLDPLQAAVLRIKLKYLDDWNWRRAGICNVYMNEISNPRVLLPTVSEFSDPAWHLFVIQHDDRDQLQKALGSAGIETLVHYPIPPHRQKAYSAKFGAAILPVAERLAKTVLSLPISPHLSKAKALEIARVVNDNA